VLVHREKRRGTRMVTDGRFDQLYQSYAGGERLGETPGGTWNLQRDLQGQQFERSMRCIWRLGQRCVRAMTIEAEVEGASTHPKMTGTPDHC
jgi:hypothetical protein